MLPAKRKKELASMSPFSIVKMSQNDAEEIAFHWHYPAPYSFYDLESDPEDLNDFIHPLSRGEHTYSVYKNGELYAYFDVQIVDQLRIELGLGMAPQHTGKGEGKNFLTQILEYLSHHYSYEFITLAVAAFNQRAISVYQRVGFQPHEFYIQQTNGGEYHFLRMIWVKK